MMASLICKRATECRRCFTPPNAVSMPAPASAPTPIPVTVHLAHLISTFTALQTKLTHLESNETRLDFRVQIARVRDEVRGIERHVSDVAGALTGREVRGAEGREERGGGRRRRRGGRGRREEGLDSLVLLERVGGRKVDVEVDVPTRRAAVNVSAAPRCFVSLYKARKLRDETGHDRRLIQAQQCRDRHGKAADERQQEADCQRDAMQFFELYGGNEQEKMEESREAESYWMAFIFLYGLTPVEVRCYLRDGPTVAVLNAYATEEASPRRTVSRKAYDALYAFAQAMRDARDPAGFFPSGYDKVSSKGSPVQAVLHGKYWALVRALDEAGQA